MQARQHFPICSIDILLRIAIPVSNWIKNSSLYTLSGIVFCELTLVICDAKNQESKRNTPIRHSPKELFEHNPSCQLRGAIPRHSGWRNLRFHLEILTSYASKFQSTNREGDYRERWSVWEMKRKRGFYLATGAILPGKERGWAW